MPVAETGNREETVLLTETRHSVTVWCTWRRHVIQKVPKGKFTES